jgi:hypothetical protein
MKPEINPVATILEYREVYDRPANLEELVSVLRDLDKTETVSLLCQMNADFRLTKREDAATARTQSAYGVPFGCFHRAAWRVRNA